MTTTTFDVLKELPEFKGIKELNVDRERITKISVTENVLCEMVDAIVSKSDGTVKIRVNGKGRGPEWKFWRDFFESSIGSAALLTTTPIEECIIRFMTSRNPCFMKVLGVVVVDSVTKSCKWTPVSMVEPFCKTTNLSPMPIIYTGDVNIEKIRNLLDKPILGVKTNGVIVIPFGNSPSYYIIPLDTAEEDILEEKTANARIMHSLGEEFVNRAFDEKDFRQAVHEEEDVKKFFASMVRKTSENLLLLEYTQRAEQEAGEQPEKAGAEFREKMLARIKKLWRRYNA